MDANYKSVVTNYGIIKLRKETKSKNIQLDYYGINSMGEKKRRKRSLGIKYNETNLEEAKEWVQTLEMNNQGELVAKKAPKNKNILVSDYMIEFEKTILIERGNRERTLKNYVSMLKNHFLPMFSNHYLNEITTDDLETMFKKIKNKSKQETGEPLNAKTLKNIKTPVNKFLEKAVKARLIKVNPLDHVDGNLFKNKTQIDLKGSGLDLETKKELIESDEEVDPFTEEEVEKLIDTAKGKFKNFIAIQFFTGMRPSELICLTWENIDIEKRFLIVEEARTGYENDQEKEKGLTKSKSSKRVIYLSKKALHFIKEQRHYSKGTEGELFKTQYGDPYKNHDSLVANDWSNLFDKPRKDKVATHKPYNLNIRHRRLYQLRHSWASINLSENRLPLLYMSNMLGHSNPEITLKKYARWVKLSHENTLDMLDKATESFSMTI